MFRGEPLALHTMLLAFVSFHLVLLAGLVITGILPVVYSFATQVHYLLMVFGWIGGLIMGAQLQFFRAITGIRKYGPPWMRSLYLASYILGLSSVVLGTAKKIEILYFAGLFLLLLMVSIHSYWLFKQVGNRLFKFPLEYFVSSHLFLLVTMVVLSIEQLMANQIRLIHQVEITHVLVVGWISLSLQGAIIRVLPMFLGTAIDRQSRKKLDIHFVLALASSVAFAIVFTFDFPLLVHNLVATAFLGVWVWTIVILVRSIYPRRAQLTHTFTLQYMFTGFFFLFVGSLGGLIIPFVDPMQVVALRRLHIHYSLLFGLSIIMLGALHRISTFQIYSILYTGRRGDTTLDDLFFERRIRLALPLLLLPAIPITIGILNADFIFWGIGGSLLFVGLLLYDSIILSNLIRYRRDRSEAIPFDLKPSEVDTTED